MALEKAITLNTGFDASYWKIKEARISLDRKSVDVYVEGYKDKATLDAGGKPAVQQFFDIPITANEVNAVKTFRNWIMNKLKEQKDNFTDAIELPDEEVAVREIPVIEVATPPVQS